LSSELLFSRLKTVFAEILDPSIAETLATRLSRSEAGSAFLTLLLELQEKSPRSAGAAIESLPEVLSAVTDKQVVEWLDIAVVIGERSGAAAVRYCKESPAGLRSLSQEVRDAVLKVVREAAEQDGALALEILRQAEGVLAAAGTTALPAWSQVGLELARWDYVLGTEYLRSGAGPLKVLELDDMKLWAGLSVKLVTPNSLGKSDYIAALTYLRTSPLLLSDIPSVGARRKVLRLGSALADRAPEAAIEFLGEAPGLLRCVGDPDWRERLLSYGMLLADKDPATALAYLRHAPDMVRLISSTTRGNDPSATSLFEDWYKQGMEVLAYNAEAARAYFAAETRKALEAIERASGSLSLREVARMLKLYAQGLSGKAVMIRAQSQESPHQPRPPVSSERGTISLPLRVGVYPRREENLRIYKLMTAHEAGRLQYGTYDVDMTRLHDIAAQAALRYGRPVIPRLESLEMLFECYPQPLLIKDLWMLAEDARIEASLKQEYPGLRTEMDAMVVEEIPRRSLLEGMLIKEMVVELLLRLSARGPEEVHVPFALEEVVSRAWALLQTVAQPGASAESVIRVAHRAYVLIEELTADYTHPPQAPLHPPAPSLPGQTLFPWDAPLPDESEASSKTDIGETKDQSASPRPGQSQGGAYHPLENFAYRGALDIGRLGTSQFSAIATNPQSVPEMNFAGSSGTARPSESSPRSHSIGGVGEAGLADRIGQPAREGETDMVGDTVGQQPTPGSKEQGVFFYDEWDSGIQDYRAGWCRVVEEAGVEGGDDFVERTRDAYGGMIRVLRRYFESIRPPVLRRLRRQADGEDVDIEAAIEGWVEWRAQAAPSDFLYVRRDRRERNVATAFLVDLSGSTGRVIGPDGSRIIDVEKQGLVVLSEALESIGDQYAVYGYSGRTRRDVRFVVLKSFEERYGPVVWRRLDAVQPLVQNRDGAAIRHAVQQLLARSARVRLLILLSDGRPLDDHYGDDYAIADTKAALGEAKACGVHVFCITVDQEASGYLARMYGDVCYLIIDRIESLPERLPRIYKMLTT
jgi:nitric oxide reductase NorD protein